ncbi:DUF7009 family protein [Dyadobacter frigoris]|uniref:Uncharacterized protein n=1 Tax=Dyadobacter frigoris TaxID=2576211 RepID=A0A4U6DF16_9BACT|nr:hypothetical protein [Dyadobacter frigoris]TKT93134.1 hypothetical protein FDK13_04565 [Dyadobacter frigoris]GLU54759.1 hypothetical protein Dfri01_42200 [Dyadobacter frigoris]
MKIRIQGNSIRIRLSKSEVDRLSTDGYVEEKTSFGKSAFGYCLQKKTGITELAAAYDDDKITMYVPETLLTEWPQNNIVGFDTNMLIGGNETLYLLLEKDFKCLDNVMEDQSDNFENPNKTC